MVNDKTGYIDGYIVALNGREFLLQDAGVTLHNSVVATPMYGSNPLFGIKQDRLVITDLAKF